jgi:hypothetical protein
MLGSLVFLTPWGALVTLTVVLPLAALVLAVHRERHARRALRLDDPPDGSRLANALAISAALALLGIAAAQPALRSKTGLRVRKDAEAIYVIDTSRSMLAAARPHAPTRIARARAAAIRLRRELADVPAGVATLTDRVLPDLLPDANVGVFERTVGESVRVDSPPPQTNGTTATSLGALGALGTQDFFSPAARHRLVVVFTDGESRPYDVQATARALRRAPEVKTLFVQVSSPGEAVFATGGKPEQGYHEDPGSRTALTALAQASGGSVVDEGSTAAAGRARAALGAGPTGEQGLTERTRPLAPWVALASLVPILLLLALWFGVAPVRGRLRSRRRAPGAGLSPGRGSVLEPAGFAAGRHGRGSKP